MEVSAARMPDAASSQYRLEIDGLDPDALMLRRFESSDHALGHDWRITLEAAGPLPDTRPLLGAPARLVIETAQGPVTHHGVAAGIEALDETADGPLWRIEMRSPLHPLAGRRHNRVFVDADPQAVCREIIQSGCPALERLEFRLGRAPAPRELLVQHEESDLEFLERILGWHGWYWMVDDADGGPLLRIGDDITDLPEVGSIDFVPQGGEVRGGETLQTLSRQDGLHPARVQVRDYNYRQPGFWPLSGEAADGRGVGRIDRATEDVRDSDEAAWLARIRLEAARCAARALMAEGDVRHLRPGYRFTLQGHPQEGVDGEYLVTALEYRADQGGSVGFGGEDTGPTWHCRLHLHPAGEAWRPEPLSENHRHGLFTARVDARGEPAPLLDEQGRYRIRIGFDEAEHPEGEASHPVRLATPHAGPDCGLHLPLHDRTEVIAACIDGNPERPVLLGALATPEQPLPATSANPRQNRLRTRGGNELVMDDTPGSTFLELSHGERSNRLRLDAKSGDESVELVSEEGEMRLECAGLMQVEVGTDSQVEVAGSREIQVEGDQRLATREGGIEASAAGDLVLTADENLHLRAEGEALNLEAGEDLVAEADGDASLHAREGDVEILAEDGRLSLSAGGDLSLVGEGGGPVHLGQAGGAIEIDTSGNLVIKGASIQLSAPSISVRGSSIGSN